MEKQETGKQVDTRIENVYMKFYKLGEQTDSSSNEL